MLKILCCPSSEKYFRIIFYFGNSYNLYLSSHGGRELQKRITKIMAVFAVASFRIMPALTRIAVTSNTINFMIPVLQTYGKQVRKLEKQKKNL